MFLFKRVLRLILEHERSNNYPSHPCKRIRCDYCVMTIMIRMSMCQQKMLMCVCVCVCVCRFSMGTCAGALPVGQRPAGEAEPCSAPALARVPKHEILRPAHGRAAPAPLLRQRLRAEPHRPAHAGGLRLHTRPLHLTGRAPGYASKTKLTKKHVDLTAVCHSG